MFSYSTTLRFRRKHENEENIEGELCAAIFCFCKGLNPLQEIWYFMDIGLLFLSQTLRLYLSFESLSQTILVLVRNLAYYSDSPALAGKRQTSKP